jgi:hypothetical protein
MSDSVGFVGRRLFAVGLAIGAVLSAALFLLVAGFRWWWCSFLGLALVAIVHRLSDPGRILDPYPWVRGVDGEVQIARMLEELEDRGYRVEEHIDIGFGDVDLVVVGPTGVFAIEVKNWAGTARQLDGRLWRNGSDASTSVRQAIRGAVAIRQRLGVPWVEAILAIPNGKVVGAPIDLKRVLVVDRDHLIPVIAERPARLSPIQVNQILATLHGSLPDTG